MFTIFFRLSSSLFSQFSCSKHHSRPFFWILAQFVVVSTQSVQLTCEGIQVNLFMNKLGLPVRSVLKLDYFRLSWPLLIALAVASMNVTRFAIWMAECGWIVVRKTSNVMVNLTTHWCRFHYIIIYLILANRSG